MFVIGLSVLVSGSVRAAVWVFGIGVIAMFDFWWPGILFLIGLSFLLGAVFPDKEKTEDAYSDKLEEPSPAPQPSQAPHPNEFPQPVPPSTPPSSSRGWLPARCPACGAPLTPTEALWIDDTHAECSYCHTPITR